MSLEFSLSLKEVSVTLDGTVYTLREFNGEERDKYANKVHSQITVGTDGKPTTVKSSAGLEAFLVHLSLFDSEGKKVPMTTIQRWPTKTISALAEESLKLSGLSADTEELGND